MAEDRASQAALPTTGRSRGIVVPFPGRGPYARPMPRGARENAEKPTPSLVQLHERRDAALNADWDRFITLAIEAWCWRDPECFAAVEDCLAHLRRSVDRDWS